MAKKKTKKNDKRPASTGDGQRTELPDIDSPQFWRGVAQAITGVDDEWKLMEVGTLFQLQSGLLRDNFKSMDKIGKEGLKMSWSMRTDRGVTPPTIVVNGNYNETHKMKAKSDCPDPNARDLPGLSREELASEQSASEGVDAKQEEEGAGDPGN